MISTGGWFSALVIAICGLVLAVLGTRKYLLMTAFVLSLTYCALMILNVSPGDWRDGQFGIEVMVLFELAFPASIVDLFSGKWLAQKLEGRNGS